MSHLSSLHLNVSSERPSLTTTSKGDPLPFPLTVSLLSFHRPDGDVYLYVCFLLYCLAHIQLREVRNHVYLVHQVASGPWIYQALRTLLLHK